MNGDSALGFSPARTSQSRQRVTEAAGVEREEEYGLNRISGDSSSPQG